ncbi:NAD(P)-dependent oxidoreductase [Corynebacterium halotolerans]|uniref:NAD(P)-dependent oxidoreductase n=1 Tax=Corynebacterium halotolerans TaxID=225326 RepID=UPI003CF11385
MIHITVIGATGFVGTDITREAAARGHEVTGVNRSGKATSPVEGVEYRAGDLTDTAAVTDLAEESDVVVISVSGGRENGDYGPVIEAHRELIEAKPDARLFIVGGAGGLETEDGTTLVDAGLIPQEYAAEPRSFVKVLELYRAADADVDWVMLAPSPEIVPGEKAGSYRLSDDRPAGDKVTTGTFAAAVLDEIEKPAHRRTRFTVADA